MSRPPHEPAHDHAQGHVHGHAAAQAHDHGQAQHDHAHGAPQDPPPALPASLLMAGAGSRLLGTLGLRALLWLAVAWALGEPGCR